MSGTCPFVSLHCFTASGSCRVSMALQSPSPAQGDLRHCSILGGGASVLSKLVLDTLQQYRLLDDFTQVLFQLTVQVNSEATALPLLQKCGHGVLCGQLPRLLLSLS